MLKSSILIDIVGYDLSQEDIKRISHPLVCGVILFSRNYKNKAQLLQLIKQIKLVRADLLISVDHEGGRVQRFKEEFFLLPSMGKLGDILIKIKPSFKIGWIFWMAYCQRAWRGWNRFKFFTRFGY